MGKGIDLARDISPLHAAVVDELKDQLLIVFLKRLGGEVIIPVAEVDDTGQNTMSMSLDQEKGTFHFVVGKKQ